MKGDSGQKRAFAASCVISNQHGQSKHTLHTLEADSRDAARGAVVARVLKEAPGFSLQSVLVAEIEGVL